MARTTAGRTRRSILTATRDLLRDGGPEPSIGAIASRAGVSRLSVYHHFGSRSGLLAAVAGEARAPAQPSTPRDLLVQTAAHWATDPALFRSLPAAAIADPIPLREVAASLAAADRLRPGCSLKEAEDVLAVLSSFPTFDRLHQSGRRSTHAVTEILLRMAGSILNAPP